MAQIVLAETPYPTCPGCGAQFSFLPAFLRSNVRGADLREIYREADARGDHSCAEEIAAFAAAHAGCPEPRRSASASGIAITEKRAAR